MRVRALFLACKVEVNPCCSRYFVITTMYWLAFTAHNNYGVLRELESDLIIRCSVNCRFIPTSQLVVVQF